MRLSTGWRREGMVWLGIDTHKVRLGIQGHGKGGWVRQAASARAGSECVGRRQVRGQAASARVVSACVCGSAMVKMAGGAPC